MTDQEWVRWEVRKWDGHIHRAADARVLGEDDTGLWLRIAKGTRVERPCGRDFDHPCEATVLLPHDALWNATWLTDWDPALYVDIAMPMQRDGDTITTMDLDLDLIRRVDGTVELVDEDEFEANRVAYDYPVDLIAKVHDVVEVLRPRLASAASPFTTHPTIDAR